MTHSGLPASASVSSGFVGAGLTSRLVYASAGPKSLPRVLVEGRRCRLSTSIVPLTSRGLPGPPVGFEQQAECRLPGRVLVRARVVSSGSRVTRAELAVRMERSGVPIAYARIDASGSGAFWVSPRCG